MKIIRKFFRQSIVLFLAGAILSAAIDVALGNAAQRYVGVIVIFTSLFIIYAAATLGETRTGIESQIDKLGLTSIWIPQAAEAYKRAAEIIRAAQHTVLVLNPYAGDKPRLIMPQERPQYLSAIEEAIEMRLVEATGPNFVYKRILQSERAKQVEGVFRRDLINESPQQSFEHCKRVFEMVKGKSSDRVEVTLLVSEPVASFPSMLIVDSKYVLVALVALHHKLGEPEQSLEWVGALFIEDRTGQKIADFERIFNRISQDAFRIHSVED